MISKIYFVVIAILIALSCDTYGQSLWKDLNFPNDINSDITSYAIAGNEIYIGTESLGVFYSPNGGRDWNPTDESIYRNTTNPVSAIVIDPKGYVYAVAEDLYVSDNKGTKWNRNFYFSRNQLDILDIELDSEGAIYVNTGKDIYKSFDRGDNWINITDNIGIQAIYGFGVSPSDYVYISIQGETDGFFRSSRDGWVHLTEGLPTNPKTEKFAFSNDNTVYVNINNSIYYSDNDGALWRKLNRTFERIDHFGSDSKGNLIVHYSRKIYVYDKKNDKWLEEISDLEIDDAIDIDVKEDYIISIKKKAILKTESIISDIIKDYSFQWIITVLDNNNNPVKNKEFDLFRMKGNLSQAFGKITTNNDGKFTVTSKNFSSGDGIKIERIVHNEPAIKLSHGELDNIMYRVKIDNVQFGNLGAWQFDILTLQEMQPTIKLAHSTFLFRLLISLEWDAKPEYLDSLTSWLRSLSNYLYDVSDGQFYIEKVAIYDKSINWRRSDIHFYASNMVWPCAWVGGIFESEGAHAHLPRKWYGNGNDSRNYTAKNDWLSTFSNYHWTTIGHELGHYMLSFFDEYVYTDTVAGKYISSSYNYGFMDYQYPNGNEWHSEMSNDTRYPNNAYKITAQWSLNGSDCWVDFEKRYEKTFDGIPCPIIKPSERSNLGGFKYFRGPNENFVINCDVGSLLDCKIFDYPSNAGDANITCYYSDSQGNLVPLPKTHIILQKSDKKLYQGQSADNGKVRILGADVGDFGYMTYSDQLNFTSYIYKFTINYLSATESGKGDNLLKDEEFTIKPIADNFGMIGTCNFDGDNMNFQNFVDKKPSNDLIIEYDLKEGAPHSETLRFDDKTLSFSSNLDKNIESEGFIIINSKDKLNQEYIVPFQYTTIPYNRRVNSLDGYLVLHLEQARNANIENFFIMSGNYLPIKSNLAEDALLLGSVHSITSFPFGSVNFRGNNFINISYSSEGINDFDTSNLFICLWNNSRKNWTILESWVDTTHHEVEASLTTLGTYALFYIPQRTDIDIDNNQDNNNMRIIPNPSLGKGNIIFNLTKNEKVEIFVSDMLGRYISTIWKGDAIAGENRLNYNLEVLSEGIYFITIRLEHDIRVGKISIVK